MTDKIKGDYGWFLVGVSVVAYEAWAIATANETLSSAFWRALKHPIARWPVVLMATGLYKHLLFPNVLPKLDPLYYVVKTLEQSKFQKFKFRNLESLTTEFDTLELV